ncbi:AzlD domain-containing protein [Geobacter sulfurreducens]|jgi:branched-subunit amino acid transport protein|uniref:AzlD family membrane protein n=1 Tax=Geobacter sulfurreducens (strain ATCC 51573 / DSM 12127 / PCA) TaxID=243231 RepID=I7FIA8_GEOSL|nr:AzlD domain-containing protein [Geobacter sulfurreducens]ADI83610.1 AzlD family membrane protein [Geobacter sulfurreducens KN400]AFP20408.1 AzlD family membrane protein [Geobacter sulfurreducens PCA]QVW36020.1 AzlD domain-containing protein [Geobacter sulfurreducens]UAC04835.1 AzlD domain-containing protein [Geobacter sulfurreducens]HBB70213.1 AzlD domain-containing protein [Geobacter sulfurreducens]
MDFQTYLAVVAGMALATYLPRMIPLVLLSNRQIPPWLADWLDLIPAAILGALLAPGLLAGETRALELGRPELIAALPTFAVALKTRSLGLTVVVGMLCYWLIGKVV